MVIRIQDTTAGLRGAGSTAADPELMARILRYTNAAPPTNPFTGAVNNINDALTTALESARGPPTPEDHGDGPGPPPPPVVGPPPTPNPYAGPQPGLSAPSYTNPFLAAGAGVGAGLNAPNYTNPFLAAGAGPGAGLDAPALIRSPIGTTTTPGAGPLPNVPAPNVRPMASTAAPAAAAPAAPAGSDRFIPIQYGTPGPSLAPQPGSRQPIYTALNLGGMFGGGANPANLPSASAQPMSGGPLAKDSMLSKAPWDYGPTQKGMVFPSAMGPKKPKSSGKARARILAPDLYG